MAEEQEFIRYVRFRNNMNLHETSLAWFRVNGTTKCTNFQPAENSSGTVRIGPKINSPLYRFYQFLQVL